MLVKFILFLIVLTPNHELNKDPDLLEEVAGYVEEAVEHFDLPMEPGRLAHFIYKESSWNYKAIGKVPNPYGVILKEEGYCQAHGMAKKLCLEAGYDPGTRKGGIMCMGYLFRYGMDNPEACGESHPGDLEASIRWFASGSCYKAREKMLERRETYEKLWKRVQEENWEGDADRLVAWRRRLRRLAKLEEEAIANKGG